MEHGHHRDCDVHIYPDQFHTSSISLPTIHNVVPRVSEFLVFSEISTFFFGSSNSILLENHITALQSTTTCLY